MPWKGYVGVAGDDGYYTNSLVFDTSEAAEVYVKDLFRRWTATKSAWVVKTDYQGPLGEAEMQDRVTAGTARRVA